MSLIMTCKVIKNRKYHNPHCIVKIYSKRNRINIKNYQNIKDQRINHKQINYYSS